jgi:hypothetical protein
MEEFKKNFFIKCFELGFEGLPEIDTIISNDVSRMADFPLGIRGYRLVDSLAQVMRKEIVADSLMLMGRRDYEKGKKRVFQICLNSYTSSRIDSIAQEFVFRENAFPHR